MLHLRLQRRNIDKPSASGAHADIFAKIHMKALRLHGSHATSRSSPSPPNCPGQRKQAKTKLTGTTQPRDPFLTCTHLPRPLPAGALRTRATDTCCKSCISCVSLWLRYLGKAARPALCACGAWPLGSNLGLLRGARDQLGPGGESHHHLHSLRSTTAAW